MSDSERPDVVAFRELEHLIGSLGDEMAAWRRRAHEAESRLREAEARLASEAAVARQTSEEPASGDPEREDGALARENEELRQRLSAARARTRQLLDRMRFLRQQHQAGVVER